MYIDWRCVDVVDDIDCFYDVTVPTSMYWSMGWINKQGSGSNSPYQHDLNANWKYIQHHVPVQTFLDTFHIHVLINVNMFMTFQIWLKFFSPIWLMALWDLWTINFQERFEHKFNTLISHPLTFKITFVTEIGAVVEDMFSWFISDWDYIMCMHNLHFQFCRTWLKNLKVNLEENLKT
jgi:hypothetical protein